MTILLLGADQSAADAYTRAGSYLPGALAFESTTTTSSDTIKHLLESAGGDTLGAVVLEAVNDDTLRLLAAHGTRMLYDPPVFDSTTRLWQLVALAERHKAWILPMMPLRLLPVIQRIKAMAAAGRLGKLLYLKATYNERLPHDSSGLVSALNKRGCHALDLARWLLGGDFVDVRVACGKGLSTAAGATDDMTILSCLLADKSYATVDISWSLPSAYPKPVSITIEIAGAGGSIRSDALNQTLQLHGCGSNRELNWGSDSRTEALRLLTDTRGAAPPVTLRDLATAQALCEDLM